MKSHCSHDILLLCMECHFKLSQRDRSLMQRFEQLAGYVKRKKKNENSSTRKLGNYAEALLKYSKYRKSRNITLGTSSNDFKVWSANIIMLYRHDLATHHYFMKGALVSVT